MLKNRLLLCVWLPLLLIVGMTGCTTARLTNLTPLQQNRNASGLYPVEVAMASRQQSMRWETIQPYVVAGTEFFPMRPTPLMSNRWETLIPVGQSTNVVRYKFKVDFEYNSIPDRRQDSLLSQEYQLRIIDGR